MPLVEKTALSRSMTEWVAHEAISQLSAWHRDGHTLNTSINASALNLEEEDFADRLLSWITAAGVPPARVELEFTESAFADDAARVIHQLSVLRESDVNVAIDDFGTGYSNFSYLQRLPATVLKIDRSFVTGLDRSEKDQLLVRTLITMAHGLGYRVVAEGIETRKTYDCLREWGCDEGQGYLMSRPVPPEQIVTRLEQDCIAA
ncbi:EAL domain-containing protein (putative c-di-GMP-specific phosphodiesterase class I) [Acetobacter oeni]|nr:EAL domain-containing protein (putative c-di-GMP-specific phosphodiesterase class I) [Acetobacter oeni]